MVSDKCYHENFRIKADVNRITDTEGGTVVSYQMDVTVHCDQCKEPFQFIGVPFGFSPYYPMMSVDGLELRVPITPQGTRPVGNLFGFKISVRTKDSLQ